LPEEMGWHGFFMDRLKCKMNSFEKEEMTTLTSCTNRLVKEGYTENFVMKDKGMQAPSNNKLYKPDDVKIVSFYRFEGESDPADNAVLYAVETNDGIKGLLIDAYAGPYVNQHIGKFIKHVEEIAKKTHTDVGPHCKTTDPTDPKVKLKENENAEEE
jgi:hypothetical protein